MFKPPLKVQSILGFEIQLLLPKTEDEITSVQNDFQSAVDFMEQIQSPHRAQEATYSQVSDLLPGQRSKALSMYVFYRLEFKLLTLPKCALRKRKTNASQIVRAETNLPVLRAILPEAYNWRRGTIPSLSLYLQQGQTTLNKWFQNGTESPSNFIQKERNTLREVKFTWNSI